MAYRLRLVRQNALKLRVRPGLLARLQGATGVNVAYAGGVYTAALDYAAFGTIPGIEAPYRGASYLLVFNRTLGLYQVISYNDLLATISATLDPTLVAIAGLAPVADQAIYFTGADAAAVYTLTPYARALLDDADALTARATLGLTIGTDVQAYDADLAALAALASNGLMARTGAGTVAARTLTPPAAGISVTNGDGVSGNPALVLANDLAALEALAGTGLAVRTAADTWAQRSLVQPAAGLSISNADGVSGNPIFALANDLAALEALASTGLAVRTGADAWTQRAIQGAANEITITNGDGVSGNPVASLPAAITLSGKTLTGGTFSGPTLTNQTDVQGSFVQSGVISPAQITADQNDYNPTGLSTASAIRIDSDASRSITGLAGGVNGRRVILHYIGAFAVVLQDESASSAAANRFALNAAITLSTDQSIEIEYDGASSRWRAIGGIGGGGGGGAPTGASYVTLATDATLTSERVLAAGNGLTLADGGAGGNATLAVGAGMGIVANADDVAIDKATQANMEAQTANKVATADNMKWHPAMPKAWVQWTVSGGAITSQTGFNATVSRNAAGDYTVTFAVPFSSANYAVIGASSMLSASNPRSIVVSENNLPTASACRVLIQGPTGNEDRAYNSVAFFGDQ